MQMAATTSGTASTSIQTEILTPFKFLHGTFAARVKFEDAPDSGPDGDQLYQTFFTISPYKSRPYSEIDFEYLPNGFGSTLTPHFFFTLWQTTHKNVSTNIAASYAGWHTWWWTTPMALTRTFTWTACWWRRSQLTTRLPSWPLISISGSPLGSLVNSSTPRTWVEQIDWVYHAKDTLLTTTQVQANVANYRSQRIMRLNTEF